MSDYQPLIDEVRALARGNDQSLTPRLEDAAGRFRTACLAVNGRLRRCEEFLSRGLRSEAVAFAQAEPPLLDALAALDFPERWQWDELIGLNGLPPSPILLVETATALNRAFPEVQALEPLLRAHRRLALARAPFSERLAQLAKLRQAEPANSVWIEEADCLELALARQLQTVAERAAAAGDIVALARTATEAYAVPWRAGMPVALSDRMRAIRLRKIAADLDVAVRAQNASMATALRDEWTALDPASVLPPNDPVWRGVTAGLHWTGKEEVRQANRDAFREALDELDLTIYRSGATLEEMRGAWTKAMKFRLSIPADVEARYDEAVKRLRDRETSRERMVLATTAAVGAVLLVAFLVFLAWPRN